MAIAIILALVAAEAVGGRVAGPGGVKDIVSLESVDGIVLPSAPGKGGIGLPSDPGEGGAVLPSDSGEGGVVLPPVVEDGSVAETL